MSKDDLQRRATAYHEAGHVVMAINCGWWINHEGVEIDARQYTGMRHRAYDGTTWRVVSVSLAGWLSEHRWHGLGVMRQGEEDLETLLLEGARHEPDSDRLFGDAYDALYALAMENPDATDAELIASFREYEADVWSELQDPKMWADIELIAAALIEKGKLNGDEVDFILGLDASRR